MNCDDAVYFPYRVLCDGDVDAHVFHPSQICVRNGGLAEQTVELGGVEEGLAGVEDGSGFGVDGFVCLQDGAGEDGNALLRGAVARWDIFEAAQCAIFSGGEYESVDGETYFWWKCEEARWSVGFRWCSIWVVAEAFAI